VIHDQVGDHADAALVGALEQARHILDRPVVGVDRLEVGDVVPAVPERRRVHRQEPDAVDAEPLQVVELLGQPAQVTAPVVVAVEESPQVDLVEDGALEPQRISLEPARSGRRASDLVGHGESLLDSPAPVPAAGPFERSFPGSPAANPGSSGDHPLVAAMLSWE
jgi:hypothetical protein